MNKRKDGLGAEALLLLTACIWGFAFVAQRVGMDYIGPFTYNGIRFAIGAASILPLYFALRRRGKPSGGVVAASEPVPTPLSLGATLVGGALAGSILFLGASLQQLGLVSTTAGNAGFITCFYVVLVPLLGIFVGHRAAPRVWFGACLALGGLYFISIGSGFVVAPGDLLELLGAFFWALHILVIARLARKIDPILLSILQFTVCSALSLIVAAFTETTTLAALGSATIPILYAGILSSGVAFTLQIIAQKRAHPARASIILSMESFFAGLGGILILGEPFSLRFGLGAALMLSGLILSQVPEKPDAKLTKSGQP